MSAATLRRWRPDFWTGITFAIIVVLVVLLIIPILRVLMLSFVDAKTLEFTLGNYIEVFTRNYYLNGLKNTLFVGVLGTIGACLLGVPLAFFLSRFHIWGRTWISTLAILVLVAMTFIEHRAKGRLAEASQSYTATPGATGSAGTAESAASGGDNSSAGTAVLAGAAGSKEGV